MTLVTSLNIDIVYIIGWIFFSTILAVIHRITTGIYNVFVFTSIRFFPHEETTVSVVVHQNISAKCSGSSADEAREPQYSHSD